MAGGRIDIDVVLDNQRLIRDLDSTMGRATATAKKAAGALGLALGGKALLDGVKDVAKFGIEFDSVLNQIRGVSGATSAEMDKISDKARQLGNDIGIPATSARDAAEAMLELGKGGLTVQQSMDAARGALQLAAAAQVDAATAAEIQSQAINTFSLKATDAGHVADVLANAANLAAGEITDIAQGLQQAGSVASQFGMSIDETSAALAVLANNGIKGSDAGTLLKSTLLALQDTGKPATAAMEELGITVYDAQGKFVGLSSIMDSLGKASKNLTEEQYNQATSILFGSDAMRLAGVAAKDGATSFNEMTKAVGEAGAASRLAEEMNKGLPGAIERISNAADETKLALYDLLRGPLTDLANFGADKLDGLSGLLKGDVGSLGDGLRPIVEDLKAIGDSLADLGKDLVGPGGALTMIGDTAQASGKVAVAGLTPVVDVVSKLVGAFSDLPAPVQTAALAMGAMALARNKLGTPGPLKALSQFSGEMKTQQRLAEMGGQSIGRLSSAKAAYGTSTLKSVTAMRSFTDQIGDVRRGATAAGQPIGLLAGTMQTMAERGGALGKIGTAFTTASAGATRFGTAAGTAAAAGATLKVGAQGILSALGGPWGLAMGGAAMALSMYSQRQQEAAQRAAEHKANVDALVGSIDAQTGALTRAGTEQMAKDLGAGKYGAGNTFDYADKVGVDADKVVAAASRQEGALDDLNVALDDQVLKSLKASDEWNKNGAVLRRAGIDAETMADALRGDADAIKKVDDAAVYGDGNLKKFREGLDDNGRSAVQLGENVNRAAQSVREAGNAQAQQERAMAQADPRARALAEAMEVLGSKTSTAAEKSSALKNALDALGGGAEGFDAAMGAAKQTLEQLPGLWAAAAVNAGGYDKIVDKATGTISTSSEATRTLSQSIYSVKNSMNQAAAAAYEYAQNQGLGDEAAKRAAETAAGQLYDSFMKSAEGARQAGIDVDALAAQMGLLPPEKVTEILTKNAGVVTAELTNIKKLLEETPDKKPITVTSLSDEARGKLEGIKDLVVKDMPDGKSVEIVAETQAAREALKDLLKTENKTVTITYEHVNPGLAGDAASALAGSGVRFATGGGVAADGAIRGPGSGTSDSIHTALPVGSHVITAAEVSAAGGHGAVNRQWPGTATASAGPLRPVALSNGEHALSPGQVAAAGGHDAVFAWRRGLRDRQRLALGGLVRAEQVGRENDGLPYITGARDCSMWVSWMVQAAKGEPLQRLFTTYSLLDGQTAGLVPGASRSDFLIVGTSSEHMTAAVMTDQGLVNTETGGNSSPSQVRWGRGAASPFDAQFTNVYHLPAELINPPPTPGTADPADPTAPTSPNTSTTTPDTTRTQTPSYIEPPKPPKAEDVAAEAAKIGVRGLLETFGLENSIFADPGQTTTGQAWQIYQNKQQFDREQSRVPDTTSTTTGTGTSKADQLALKQQYENDNLALKQQYETDRAAAKGDQARQLEIKQKYDQDRLTRKQKYDQDRVAGTQQSVPSGPTTGPADTNPAAMVDSAPYDPSRGAEQWSKEIAAALRITGMASTLAKSMEQQGDIESGGDPRAVGPDSADGTPQGWMQVKPGTFAAHRDPSLPDDPFNVLANGVAALRYADKQYDGQPPWPSTAGYAAGGLRPLAGGKAAVVPPNAWRVIGDRQHDDEFYIPDTDDPQHVALGAEWARRRGYQLVQMHADGGIRARAAGGQTALLDREPVVAGATDNSRNYNYSGPAAQAPEFFRAARRHDKLDVPGAGITRIGRRRP